MDGLAVERYFCQLMAEDSGKSPALAAIETLYIYLQRSQAETLQGLNSELQAAVEAMICTDHSTASVSSATELFKRFITLASLDQPDFKECKQILLSRGEKFIEQVKQSRAQIAVLAGPLIRDGSCILTHSYSRVVLQALQFSAKHCASQFHVFVTISAPDSSGEIMCQKLKESGISSTLILDSASAYIMEKIDFVLVGAEGVVENGGIINKIGTYAIAIAAKMTNKPVYVMAESVKFVKEYPLNQRDIPVSFKFRSSVLKSGSSLNDEHPLVDYTPPDYVRLLITDIGIMTPAAVSDELLKLYL